MSIRNTQKNGLSPTTVVPGVSLEKPLLYMQRQLKDVAAFAGPLVIVTDPGPNAAPEVYEQIAQGIHDAASLPTQKTPAFALSGYAQDQDSSESIAASIHSLETAFKKKFEGPNQQNGASIVLTHDARLEDAGSDLEDTEKLSSSSVFDMGKKVDLKDLIEMRHRSEFLIPVDDQIIDIAVMSPSAVGQLDLSRFPDANAGETFVMRSVDIGKSVMRLMPIVRPQVD